MNVSKRFLLSFALAFTSDHDWDPGYLFAGFVLILMTGWIAPFVIKGN